jgi:hypothetical protein
MRSTLCKANKNLAVVIAIVACMMLAASTSAFAVPASQVSRVLIFNNFTGLCCFLLNQTVKVTEAAPLVPVIVTWSADVLPNDEFWVGLSLNGGACIAYGSREIDLFSPTLSGYTSTTHQWIVLPSDGLKKGTNTFELCGGGVYSASDTMVIGLSTLAVQISN